MKKILILFLAAFLLFSGCIGEKTVKKGDTVSVNYTGSLQDGKVFDTNLESVAKQHDIIKPEYVPLKFTVGEPGMIKGFDEGVVGMKVGETKTLTIPPENGYGNVDPTKINVVSRLQVFPAVFPKVEDGEIPIESFEETFGSGHKVGETVTVPNDPKISVTIRNITSKDLFKFFEPAFPYELYKYLKQKYGIDFPIYAKVELNEKTGQIKISHEKNYIFLKLNDDKSSATIDFDDGRTDILSVRDGRWDPTIYTSNVSFSINYNYQVGDKIYYGFPWNITVIKIDDKNITVKHDVKKDYTFQSQNTPWNTTVTDVNSMNITLRSNAIPDTEIQTMFGTPIKVHFNETSIIMDQNHELAGKTLIFNITLKSIDK